MNVVPNIFRARFLFNFCQVKMASGQYSRPSLSSSTSLYSSDSADSSSSEEDEIIEKYKTRDKRCAKRLATLYQENSAKQLKSEYVKFLMCPLYGLKCGHKYTHVILFFNLSKILSYVFIFVSTFSQKIFIQLG